MNLSRSSPQDKIWSKKGVGETSDDIWKTETEHRVGKISDEIVGSQLVGGGGSNPVEGPFWGQLPYFRNFHNEERQIAVSACRYRYIWEELVPNLVWRADSGKIGLIHIGAFHILRNTGWGGGLPDLLQYYIGGSPQFITILHMGVGIESLLQ